MKLHWVLICAVTIVTVCGCGSVGSELTSGDAAGEFDSRSPVSDVPAAIVENSKLPDAEVFQPPFPANESFFSQPRLEDTSTRSDVLRSDDQQVTVRVIGFSQLGDSEPHALLEIDGTLASVHAGDSIKEIRVVTVDSPNVTFQHRNDRWTVALFGQPLVRDRLSQSRQGRSTVGDRSGAATSAVFPRQSAAPSERTIAAKNQFDPGHANSFGNQQLDGSLPPTPKALPTGSLPPTVSLPSDLALPASPVLPEPATSSIQSLPGIDELPQLPTR